MPLAESRQTRLLAWFPTQVRMLDGLCDCPDSLVRLTTWLGLCSRYCIQQKTELYISFPSLSGKQYVSQGLYSSLFGSSCQASVCTKFPGHVRPLVLLYRWGKPWALFFVQISLFVGLLDGLCIFLYTLIRSPVWTG